MVLVIKQIMHEGNIAQNIISIVNEELLTRGLCSKVKKIVFKAGRIHAIVPESLCFFFDIIKKDHIGLADAELVVEEIPLVVSCSKCSISYEINEPFFWCKNCSEPVSIISGKGMSVDSFDVD